ncbi:MAG: hypothetical protein ACYCU8_08210 [Ferrimicrobium acidiphilum]
MIYTDGQIYKTTSVSISHSAIVAFVEANPELRYSVAIVDHLRPYIDCPPSALIAAHWIIASVNGTNAADYFFHQLAHKSGEAEGSAILTLDRRLRKIKGVKGRYSPREFLALLIKAWNYDTTGKSARSLSITQNGQFSIPDVARLKTLD